MDPSHEIKFICSLDGWTKVFEYGNFYEPHPRLGTIFLAWYADGKTIPEYGLGPRMFFTSDDDMFSHADMYYSINPKYWHYNNGRAMAAGLFSQMIDLIQIVPRANDWTLTLTGAVTEEIERTPFEKAMFAIHISRNWECGCENHFEKAVSATLTGMLKKEQIDHETTDIDDEGREWSGVPLWFLTGYVDEEDRDREIAYNVTLAQEGYDITVIGADGSKAVISSIDADRNSNFIIANALDGKAITTENGGPLRFVGAGVNSADSITNVVEIQLDLESL
jgi:DMSO/TMAO reductase YedYZ molybdopterin-dependent catalytic subunit